jgi:hypothetical protein
MKILVLFFCLLFINVYVHAQEMDDDKYEDIQLAILKIDKISQLYLYGYNIRKGGEKVDSTLILTENYTYYEDGHIQVKQVNNNESHRTKYRIYSIAN